MEIYTLPVSGPEGAGKFIIYRPLAGLAFVGNKAMADLTRARVGGAASLPDQTETEAFLHRIGFLEPDPTPPPQPGEDFQPTTAVLLLTNQCQLRCTYCYASAGESAPNELSFDLGKAAIDYACMTAQKLGRPGFEVSFHGGGEPTMAWKTLQAFVAYARQKPLPAKLTVTSNGIWSLKKCEWLMDHLDGISLSMDGSPRTQNHNRPYSSGKGSSEQVMRTIETLDRRGFDYGIRMTAASPWEDFPEDVRFLCAETMCRSMQVEPAFNTQRGGHVFPSVAEARAFGEAFLEAYQIAKQAGRRLYYSGARLGQVTSTFCSAPYNALVVNASGKVVSCYEVASDAHFLGSLSIIGGVEDGVIRIDQPARERLHVLMAERRATCQDCFCYWSCAGDCYTRSFAPRKNGHMQFSGRCELNRYLLEKLLLWSIAEEDGVWHASRMYSSQVIQAPTAGAITI